MGSINYNSRDIINYNITNKNLFELIKDSDNHEVLIAFLKKGFSVDTISNYDIATILIDADRTDMHCYTSEDKKMSINKINEIRLDIILDYGIYLDYRYRSELEYASLLTIEKLYNYGFDFYSIINTNNFIYDIGIEDRLDIVDYLLERCNDLKKYSYTYVNEDIIGNIYYLYKNFEKCEYLFKKGLFVSENSLIFQHACSSGDIESIIYLLKKGFDINKNIKGSNAFHVSIKCNQIGVVSYLLDNGADIEKPDNNGNTPLILAVKEKHLEIVKILIKANANINSMNNDKMKAIDIIKIELQHIENKQHPYNEDVISIYKEITSAMSQ